MVQSPTVLAGIKLQKNSHSNTENSQAESISNRLKIHKKATVFLYQSQFFKIDCVKLIHNI